MVKSTLIIKAVKYRDGYILVANNGDKPTENYVYRTKSEAYSACDKMYNNRTWRGKKVSSGYQIYI